VPALLAKAGGTPAPVTKSSHSRDAFPLDDNDNNF
jgi:hypothetical protein